MMKNNILFALLFLFSINASAVNYSFIKTLNERAVKVIPASSGDFYSLSYQPNCPDDYIVVRHFDAQGNVQSAFKSPAFIGTVTSYDAVVNTSNNLVLYVRVNEINHMLYELSPTGTVIWNNNLQFTNPLIKFLKIKLAPNGYYLLGNTVQPTWSDSSHAILTKLNTSGKHVWTKSYRLNHVQPASTNYLDMIYENNKLVCVGHYYFTSSIVGQPAVRPLVTTFDTAGNMLQSYAYTIDSSFMGVDGYEFVQIEKTPNGSYYLVGNNFGNEHALFKLNAAFQIQWIKEKLSGRASSMCAGFNEDVFIAPDGEFGNFIEQFDSTGQVLGNHVTKKVAGNDISLGQVTCLKKDDCGFLLSNDETMYAHLNKQMNYCIDSSLTSFGNYYPVTVHIRNTAPVSVSGLFNLNEYLTTTTFTVTTGTVMPVCNTTYVCNGATGIESEEAVVISIYPNPATTSLSLSLPETYSNTRFTLSDLKGHLVQEGILATGGIHQLQLAECSNGVYLLKLSNEHRTLVHKVIIRK